jgi:hypothetical protein
MFANNGIRRTDRLQKMVRSSGAIGDDQVNPTSKANKELSIVRFAICSAEMHATFVVVSSKALKKAFIVITDQVEGPTAVTASPCVTHLALIVFRE